MPSVHNMQLVNSLGTNGDEIPVSTKHSLLLRHFLLLAKGYLSPVTDEVGSALLVPVNWKTWLVTCGNRFFGEKRCLVF